MKAVQTFWCANKDPLTYGFGWLSPQSNLMSWSLSCLLLRECYEEVVLYTDTAGYDILSGYLQLPYTDVVVSYDNLPCKNELWAYPKLLTYAAQDKPFIHFDGNVYLPSCLKPETVNAELIVQNQEEGTQYYNGMMRKIMEKLEYIPDFLREELEKDSISSFNAGIFGGNDVHFINEFCRTAFDFIEKNSLNTGDIPMNSNYNILFEQILFSAFVLKHTKQIETIIKHTIRDNGYSYQDFCDFYSYGKYGFMHIIGGHKTNKRVNELLYRILLMKYPEYLYRIIKLFSTGHKLLNKKNQLIQKNAVLNNNSTEEPEDYKKFRNRFLIKWKGLTKDDLLVQEKKSCNYLQYITDLKTEFRSMIINKNPYLSIYEVPGSWPEQTIKNMKRKIALHFYTDRYAIALLPDLPGNGYQEILLDNLAFNILSLLKTPDSCDNIRKKLQPHFPAQLRGKNDKTDRWFLSAIEYLFLINLFIQTD